MKSPHEYPSNSVIISQLKPIPNRYYDFKGGHKKPLYDGEEVAEFMPIQYAFGLVCRELGISGEFDSDESDNSPIRDLGKGIIIKLSTVVSQCLEADPKTGRLHMPIGERAIGELFTQAIQSGDPIGFLDTLATSE